MSAGFFYGASATVSVALSQTLEPLCHTGAFFLSRKAHCGSVGNARDARNNAENKKQHTLRPEIVTLLMGKDMDSSGEPRGRSGGGGVILYLFHCQRDPFCSKAGARAP